MKKKSLKDLPSWWLFVPAPNSVNPENRSPPFLKVVLETNKKPKWFLTIILAPLLFLNLICSLQQSLEAWRLWDICLMSCSYYIVQLGLNPDSSDDKCHTLSTWTCYVPISKNILRSKAQRSYHLLEAVVCWAWDNNNSSHGGFLLFTSVISLALQSKPEE